MDNGRDFDLLLGCKVKFYGVCGNAFKIDDLVFEAMEDENDGYRSCLGAIDVKDEQKDGLIFFKKHVAVCKLTHYCGPDDYVPVEGEYHFHREGIDFYRLTDRSGHVWLEFGTDNTDDYYPCFIFRYNPKAPKT